MTPIVLDNTIFSLQRAGGVSGDWASLIEQLLHVEGLQLRFVERPDAANNIFRSRLHIPADSIIPDTRLPLHLARYIPAKIEAAEPFIFHTPYYRVCSNPQAINVVTLHDFTYEVCREHGRLATLVHTRQKYHALRHAHAIVAVSDTTLRDMQRLVPEKLTAEQSVIPNPPLCIPSPDFRPTSDPDHYILYVGARSGYKNFSAVIEALKDTSLHLTIAGAPLTKRECKEAAKLIAEHRLKEFIYPGDGVLSRLYANAWCLLYPSSYEGFGIPIIEAQTHGCPVITGPAPASIATAGDAAITLCSPDSSAITAAIHSLADPTLRQHLIQAGLTNAARFSPTRTARLYLNLYQSL